MDLATLELGTTVQELLAQRDKQGRPVHTVQELLGGQRRPEPTGFRSLRARAQPARVGADGVW